MLGSERARLTFGIVAGCLGLCIVLATPALAGDQASQGDPVASVVIRLAVILMAAMVGGDLATRVGQPAVLGELTVGVLLGNIALLGVPALESIKTDPSIDMLARLGVLLLLFEVGLESTVGQMLKVGFASLAVASLGVAAPFALGCGTSALLLPDANVYVHLFVGATLSATSVGITARVLKDIGKSQSAEARIILGAAVIDDVMGLVLLAVVSGVIAAANEGGAVSYGTLVLILVKATIFLVGSLALGVWIAPRLFHLASKLKARGVLLAVGLAFCFLLCWTADAIGLAPIVGAFAAGLILEAVHYRDFVDRGEHGLEKLIEPISSFLVPVFFVLMGMHTDLRAFAQPGVVGLAVVLTLAAIAGKQACALGVPRGVDRWSVAIGMVPRGEVGLIFASIGRSLSYRGAPVISASTYSAIVVMVMLTTVVTPPALKWSFSRSKDPLT